MEKKPFGIADVYVGGVKIWPKGSEGPPYLKVENGELELVPAYKDVKFGHGDFGSRGNGVRENMKYSELKKRIKRLRSLGYEKTPFGYEKIIQYSIYKSKVTIPYYDVTDTIPEVFRVLPEYREDQAFDSMLELEETKMMGDDEGGE